MRCRRRSKLRYRAPRSRTRTKPEGWLAPSLQHRVDTTLASVATDATRAPRGHQLGWRLHMQALEILEISGVEYQQGTLRGYELREYLLAKWGESVPIVAPSTCRST